MAENFTEVVRETARRKILFLPHAITQMNLPDRMIAPAEVRHVVHEGEIIEDYPENVRGHGCLILGYGEGQRPIHVICAPKGEYLAIISAYIPGPERWEADFKTRRR